MLKFLKRLYNNELEVDFLKYQKFSFTLSGFMVLLVLCLMLFSRVNFGIDFVGGLSVELRSDAPFNLEEIREKISTAGFSNSTTQAVNNENILYINIKSNDSKDVEKIKALFSNTNVEYTRVEFVGSQLSSEAVSLGIMAIAMSFLGVFIYLCIRFGWKFAVSGLVGLMHDFILCFLIFVISDLEFNIPSVAALLTVIGYSINDSVVIFDRIRSKMFNLKQEIEALINSSINSTIFRSLFTSFTTLVAILPVAVFCTGEMKTFAIIVSFGIIVGTYSSIFLSSFLMCTLLKDNKK